MEKNNKLVFDKINYIIMIAGLLVLTLGYIIMGMDNQPHGFGFLGLTLGPIIVLIGFIIEFFAIFYKPRNKE